LYSGHHQYEGVAGRRRWSSRGGCAPCSYGPPSEGLPGLVVETAGFSSARSTRFTSNRPSAWATRVKPAGDLGGRPGRAGCWAAMMVRRGMTLLGFGDDGAVGVGDCAVWTVRRGQQQMHQRGRCSGRRRWCRCRPSRRAASRRPATPSSMSVRTNPDRVAAGLQPGHQPVAGTGGRGRRRCRARVATALSMIAPDQAGRAAGRGPVQGRVTAIEGHVWRTRPTTITFGDGCRCPVVGAAGSRRAVRATPTALITQPIGSPRRSANPWWSTSQESSPSWGPD